MIKHLLAVCVTTCAANLFAQGTIVFGNNIPNSVVAPIHGPDPLYPWIAISGNDSHSYPAGDTPYGGPALTAADQVTVQLWGGPNAGSLAPVPNAQAAIVDQGFFTTLSSPVAVPGVAARLTATLQVRAWQNEGGTVTSWAAAVAAGAEFGESQVFNIHTPAPEPSTFVLVALGGAVLMALRSGR